MTALTNDPESAARGTLALLETRLRRLEFLLTGSTHHDGQANPVTKPSATDETVTSQLQHLQNGLSNLKRLDGQAGSLVRDVDKLYLSNPEVFSENSMPEPRSLSAEELSTPSSVVLSHASLYPETASRLSSLQTLHVPPAEQSTKLIELSPRIGKIQDKQAQLESQIRDLKQRSARCLEWWVRIGVVSMGELWEDLEDRIEQIERNVAWHERREREQ